MNSITKKHFYNSLFLCYGIDIFLYDEKNKLMQHVGNPDNYYLEPDEILLNKLRKKCVETILPCIFTEMDYFIYGAFLDSKGILYVCGPGVLGKMQPEQRLRFYERYKISCKKFYISECKYEKLANLMAILYMYTVEKAVSEIEILAQLGHINKEYTVKQDNLLQHAYEQSVTEIERYGQKTEELVLRMVEDGDIDNFKKNRHKSLDTLERIGNLAKSDKKKLEYTFVTILALTRTSAVKGGMNYMESCAMSDMYLKKLEQCTDNDQILALMYQMRVSYIQRVHNIKQNDKKNSYIEYCKDYICLHITQPFDRGELAKKLGLNKDYLSALFSEYEGMSLSEYRMKVRLRAAANLLKYSDYSIADIAERFRYPSASNFSMYFKKEFDMTPKKYRNIYKREEFT